MVISCFVEHHNLLAVAVMKPTTPHSTATGAVVSGMSSERFDLVCLGGGVAAGEQ